MSDLKIDVRKREVAIINYLRARNDAATVREIYDAVSKEIGDDVSRPSYYKLLNGLVASGKIDEVGGPGPARYALAPRLHATNRITLDDVYEAIPFTQATETIARALEAQRYFLDHRTTVIRKAAEALCQENAVHVFFLWIHDMLKILQTDLDTYHALEKEGVLAGTFVFADSALEHRIRQQCDILRDILYRQLSLPIGAVDLRDWDGPGGLKGEGEFWYDPDELRRALELRVFGVGEQQSVLGLVLIDEQVLAKAAESLLIAGSDGSFYAGTLGIQSAQTFVEDESFVVTFNNSVAFVRPSERVAQQRGNKPMFYSVPIKREAMDDPTNKGMVLAPFMFPMLNPSEYDHMARAATDVVQMRVDDEIFNGTARDIESGEKITPPRVHIRDGTITPQERYFNHYYRSDPYGDIVREGIERSRNILQRIVTSRGKAPIYAGAVKSTQNKLFSRFLNWYIARGSRMTRNEAIDPNWDISRGSFISDIDAMTVVMASLEPRKERDGLWASCVVLRQFASLTEFFDPRIRRNRDWFTVLKDRRDKALQQYVEEGGDLPYHAMLSDDDLENDAYLYLLELADYASFYIGHTQGDPPPKIPRYEFLCSLRSFDPLPQQSRMMVKQSVEDIVTALLISGFTIDRDHNYLSKTILAKIIPAVVYRAHEYAKHLGKRLETQFKSIVVARLAKRQGQSINEEEVEIHPLSFRRFLQRIADTNRALPPPNNEEHD